MSVASEEVSATSRRTSGRVREPVNYAPAKAPESGKKELRTADIHSIDLTEDGKTKMPSKRARPASGMKKGECVNAIPPLSSHPLLSVDYAKPDVHALSAHQAIYKDAFFIELIGMARSQIPFFNIDRLSNALALHSQLHQVAANDALHSTDWPQLPIHDQLVHAVCAINTKKEGYSSHPCLVCPEFASFERQGAGQPGPAPYMNMLQSCQLQPQAQQSRLQHVPKHLHSSYLFQNICVDGSNSTGSLPGSKKRLDSKVQKDDLMSFYLELGSWLFPYSWLKLYLAATITDLHNFISTKPFRIQVKQSDYMLTPGGCMKFGLSKERENVWRDQYLGNDTMKFSKQCDFESVKQHFTVFQGQNPFLSSNTSLYQEHTNVLDFDLFSMEKKIKVLHLQMSLKFQGLNTEDLKDVYSSTRLGECNGVMYDLLDPEDCIITCTRIGEGKAINYLGAKHPSSNTFVCSRNIEEAVGQVERLRHGGREEKWMATKVEKHLMRLYCEKEGKTGKEVIDVGSLQEKYERQEWERYEADKPSRERSSRIAETSEFPVEKALDSKEQKRAELTQESILRAKVVKSALTDWLAACIHKV